MTSLRQHHLKAQDVYHDCLLIRSHAPLVHNITNFVVMNTTANALLSLGASPVMAHAKEEVCDMVTLASSLVLNIGTLDENLLASMLIAGQKAFECGTPIVLDPVGAGASTFRTEACLSLIEACHPTIIRGNASEIAALAHLPSTKTKGVDSTIASDDVLSVAQSFAIKNKAIICISGQTDYITDGINTIAIHNHIPLMPKVTGMGCTASALCGAFAAVQDNPLIATAHAMAVMATAGEKTMLHALGPGSFQSGFLDALYLLTALDIEQYLSSEKIS